MAPRAIENLLPSYDVHEVHRRVYPASPAAVREALESLRPNDLPLTRVLLAIRLLGRSRPEGRTMLEGIEGSGFARLADTPNDVVFAVVGRFWRADGGRRPAVADAEAFRAFATPGYAKAVMSFELLPCDGGTELLTETRVLTTSAGARRAFRAYWLLVGTGSALIRRELLAAVGKRLPRRAVA